jgi:hypothetical protein
MDLAKAIQMLDGAPVVAVAESAWGPTGKVSVTNIQSHGSEFMFDLLVPTSANDIWDYIWQSEREKDSTDKVQLFQGDARVVGSRISAIRREGMSDRWDANGPERYRLTFTLPGQPLASEPPMHVRFFWGGNLMSTAG